MNSPGDSPLVSPRDSPGDNPTGSPGDSAGVSPADSVGHGPAWQRRPRRAEGLWGSADPSPHLCEWQLLRTSCLPQGRAGELRCVSPWNTDSVSHPGTPRKSHAPSGNHMHFPEVKEYRPELDTAELPIPHHWALTHFPTPQQCTSGPNRDPGNMACYHCLLPAWPRGAVSSLSSTEIAPQLDAIVLLKC